PFSALRAHIGWWLDLYRWEFPLPEREALAAEIGRWLAYYREAGALVGDGAALDHPIIRATAGILENFREAYLVVARTAAAQEEWPILQSALAQRMPRQFQTSLLLGAAHAAPSVLVAIGDRSPLGLPFSRFSEVALDGPDGLFSWDGSALGRIAVVGDASPAGGAFTSVGLGTLNDAGVCAFRASISSG